MTFTGPEAIDLTVFFLAQGEQTGTETINKCAEFIRGAQKTLDFALYDFRLDPSLKTIIAGALQERSQAGVAIRIAYDADKPEVPNYEAGMDPAPAGTGYFVQSLGYPFRRIGGLKLMHNKYIIRDAALPGAAVWTGTTNLTDDALTLQENNIVQLKSDQLAGYYHRDFEDLWQAGDIGTSGSFDTSPVQLNYKGEPLSVRVLFSPGRGPAIDYEVARRVANARNRVRVCSMLLNSGALIAALSDQIRIGRVQVSGIYDQTQMEGVFLQWQTVPQNQWKVPAIQGIVREAKLVGKRSTPYTPTSTHDFMHNKVLVADDTVITGSYNFSHSAEMNSENILMLTNRTLADEYSQYIDHLMQKYGG